ncbi:RETST reductase, partial [Phaetusa simplex]|nr:RETST reductase [Phaetusa simplex]
GIHYVGQMQEGSVMRFVVDQLTEGPPPWARLPAAYDAVVLGEPGHGRTYRIYAGEKEYFRALKEQFPGEEAAIDEFKQLVKVEEASPSPPGINFLRLWPLRREGKFPAPTPGHWAPPRSNGLAQPAPKGIPCPKNFRKSHKPTFWHKRPLFFTGVVPSKASFTMHSILVNHFLHGAWYPKGGAGEIAFHTIPVIRKTGGNVLGKAPVQRILLDSQGKACGVSVKKGQDVVNIFAPVIISDAGILNTYERLLPAEARALPGIQSQLRIAAHGEGGFTVFVGLNGSREELGLEATNYFMYPGNDLDEIVNRYLTSSREEAAKNIPLLFVTCPSAKDPTWEMRHPGKSTMAIVTFAKYEWFEEWKDKQVNKRGDDYEELKKTFVDAIMQAVFKLYPRIEDRIEYISGGTPLTNQHYIASHKGEIYGMDHSITRMQAEAIATMRAQTAIPNLYLTGQDVCVGGFMGALQGALICTSAVLKRNLYVDVVQLKRRTEATNSKK